MRHTSRHLLPKEAKSYKSLILYSKDKVAAPRRNKYLEDGALLQDLGHLFNFNVRI